MVSMKDIARRCGVSVATVSKALNGQSDIGEETRLRIQATAKEMGYMANSAARALKTNRTYNLGLLFADERRQGLVYEYFSTMMESFRAEAKNRGYDVTLINHSMGGEPTSYLQQYQYRGMDGMVIACVDFTDPRVREVVDSSIPLVTIDHVFENRMAVLSDNAAGIEALVRYAYGKGHRKIAYIHGEDNTVTRNRMEGFRRVCQQLNLNIPEEYIREGVYHDPELCGRLTRELLSLPDRPSCILFPSDYTFVGGLNAIREMGLRMPEDISAMGYDGIYVTRGLNLTTYIQNANELGRVAADRLIRLIEQPGNTPIERVAVSGRLLEGSSVAEV